MVTLRSGVDVRDGVSNSALDEVDKRLPDVFATLVAYDFTTGDDGEFSGCIFVCVSRMIALEPLLSGTYSLLLASVRIGAFCFCFCFCF